jgi:hypothetical protein
MMAIMCKFVIAAVLSIVASPALAQFPPPGVYMCIDSAGDVFGTWNLFVAGDYEFTAKDGTSGKGQVSSAGTSVEALTGPLADIHAKGSFGTDETSGETKFALTSDKGDLRCGLPPE